MRNFDDLSEREMLALAISQRRGRRPHLRRLRRRPARELSRRPPRCSPRWRPRRTSTAAGSSTSSSRSSASTFRSFAGRTFAAISRASRSGSSARSASTRCATARREMEQDAARFYRLAIDRASDAAIRKLLGDLAEAEDKHEHLAADARGDDPHPGGAPRRGRARAPPLRPADHPAGPGRPDGRLGVDAGAGVRRRLRDPQALERLSRRPRGVARRRHLDGLRRGAGRRRQAVGPRRAAAARRRLRPDDDRPAASATPCPI